MRLPRLWAFQTRGAQTAALPAAGRAAAHRRQLEGGIVEKTRVTAEHGVRFGVAEDGEGDA